MCACPGAGSPPDLDMAAVPQNIFRELWGRATIRKVRPPTLRDLGTKVVKLKPFMSSPEVIQEAMSTARGLPPEDESAGILRATPGGVVKPEKETSAGMRYKIKLQDPSHIETFLSFEKVKPKRGLGAARLKLADGMYLSSLNRTSR